MSAPRKLFVNPDGYHWCSGITCPCRDPLREPLRVHPYMPRPTARSAPFMPVAYIDLLTQEVAGPVAADAAHTNEALPEQQQDTQDPFEGPESPLVIPGSQDPDYTPEHDQEDSPGSVTQWAVPASPASSGSQTPDLPELIDDDEHLGDQDVVPQAANDAFEEAEAAEAIARVAAFEAAEEAAFMEAAIARVAAVEAREALDMFLNNPGDLPRIGQQDLDEALGII